MPRKRVNSEKLGSSAFNALIIVEKFTKINADINALLCHFSATFEPSLTSAKEEGNGAGRKSSPPPIDGSFIRGGIFSSAGAGVRRPLLRGRGSSAVELGVGRSSGSERYDSMFLLSGGPRSRSAPVGGQRWGEVAIPELPPFDPANLELRLNGLSKLMADVIPGLRAIDYGEGQRSSCTVKCAGIVGDIPVTTHKDRRMVTVNFDYRFTVSRAGSSDFLSAGLTEIRASIQSSINLCIEHILCGTSATQLCLFLSNPISPGYSVGTLGKASDHPSGGTAEEDAVTERYVWNAESCKWAVPAASNHCCCTMM